MDQVRKKLRAEDAHERGITGRGITVAVMDTGERVIILPS